MNAGGGNLWFPGRIAPQDEHDNHMEIKIIMLPWVFSDFATTIAWNKTLTVLYHYWASKGKLTLQTVALHLLGLRETFVSRPEAKESACGTLGRITVC